VLVAVRRVRPTVEDQHRRARRSRGYGVSADFVGTWLSHEVAAVVEKSTRMPLSCWYVPLSATVPVCGPRGSRSRAQQLHLYRHIPILAADPPYHHGSI
jgi:hypothetical protein